MSSLTKSRPRYPNRRLDIFCLRVRRRLLLVQVIEDHGTIRAPPPDVGLGVELNDDPEEPVTSEVPEDDLEPAQISSLHKPRDPAGTPRKLASGRF